MQELVRAFAFNGANAPAQLNALNLTFSTEEQLPATYRAIHVQLGNDFGGIEHKLFINHGTSLPKNNLKR